MAKKVGLSFGELNMLTLQNFVDFIDLWVGEDKKGPRKAKQDDIDNFYSNM